jgi:hypothetical protein
MTLLPIANAQDGEGEQALLATATLDGIAGAAIWASTLGKLKTFLFTPEGETTKLLTMPALRDAANLARVFAFSLPLTDADLPALTHVLERPTIREVVWLDHHFLHTNHVEALQERHARLVHDPSFFSATELLIDHLPEPPEWAPALAAALADGAESAPEPWRSWLTVFLAVRSEPYSIRHAISPLIDGRLEAFDPALVAAGSAELARLRKMAASPMHEQKIAGWRVVVAGLPPSEQQDYRLLTDMIRRERSADVVVAFFDGVARLVVAGRIGEGGMNSFELDLALESRGLTVFHYDAGTFFVETETVGTLASIELVLEALAAQG